MHLAGVRSGSRVLDVAAGYGEPALTAARRAGPEGRVVATDISAAMLAFGRERAAAAGLGNVEFMESDASSLEFVPRASTPPSRAGASSSSPTRSAPRGASEASSRQARGWRSARGASPIRPERPGPLPAHPGRNRRVARRGRVLQSRRVAGRGHLRVRLPGALHRLYPDDLRPDPGSTPARPNRTPGTRSRRPQRRPPSSAAPVRTADRSTLTGTHV